MIVPAAVGGGSCPRGRIRRAGFLPHVEVDGSWYDTEVAGKQRQSLLAQTVAVDVQRTMWKLSNYSLPCS